MYEIRVEIAEVPFLLRSRFEEFTGYFRRYQSDKEPRFIIDPTDEDLERIGASIERTEETDGLPKTKRSVMFLELVAVHAALAEKMVYENVLLMHGSALSYNGEAVVFTAKSGTGKSTHSRLWREAYGDRVDMINDDKPFIRIEDCGVRVYGTPWNGKHHLGRNISAPLKAIVSLERGAVNSISPLSKAFAFPMVVESSYSSADPTTAQRIVDLEKKLLNTADFYVLRCNMDPDAAHVAREGIFGPDARQTVI